MTLYLALLAALLLLRYAVGIRSPFNRPAYRVVLVILFLFSAFRFEVGCDWTGYLNQFITAQDMTFNDALENRETIWWVSLWLQVQQGIPYPWINVITSAIFFGGIHVLARRQPDPLGFLVLLFPVLIVNMPMSGIRQAAGIGLICIAFTAFIDRRLVRFLIWVLLAAGFHSSAAAFLLLAPFVRGSYTKGRFLLSAVLALPGLVLMARSETADVAFSRYVNTGTDAFGAAYRTGVLFLSGLFFQWFMRRQWRVSFPQSYKLASLGALMMVAALPLVVFSSVIADRFGYYCIPIQAMIFARIPYLRRKPDDRMLAVAPYLGLALVFIVWVTTSSLFTQCYLPYRTWLFGFPSDMRYLF